MDKHLKILEQMQVRRLAQDVADIEVAGIHVTQLVREGDPDKEIVAAAKEIAKAALDMDADLIVMGSHSRRNLWDALLGNTAEKLSKYAACLVLIVTNPLQKQNTEA